MAHCFRLSTGFDREGRPIKVDASGWQARILQYKCDHLERTLYVGKMVPRTFKVVENLSLLLPAGSHFLGNLLGSIFPCRQDRFLSKGKRVISICSCKDAVFRLQGWVMSLS
ncbi:unnamed protein product [Ilex paraguariensis]|uniref:Peptide deformylase n=1 Tax=Ilex paraguariensis TaxID=185542 RepID=A0ABC8TMA5_9AQUA